MQERSKNILNKLLNLPPSKYLEHFSIILTTKHAYLLDCYYYNWEINEMPKWMKEKGQTILTKLINISKNYCLPFDNFIKKEKIPRKLISIGNHCSMLTHIFFDINKKEKENNKFKINLQNNLNKNKEIKERENNQIEIVIEGNNDKEEEFSFPIAKGYTLEKNNYF
ncbi:hypothetical protein Mgra_00007143, partial [Meloidogyne graminicola]